MPGQHPTAVPRTLGVPVVPEVYMMVQMSSLEGGTAGQEESVEKCVWRAVL